MQRSGIGPPSATHKCLGALRAPSRATTFTVIRPLRAAHPRSDEMPVGITKVTLIMVRRLEVV